MRNPPEWAAGTDWHAKFRNRKELGVAQVAVVGLLSGTLSIFSPFSFLSFVWHSNYYLLSSIEA